MKSSKIVTVLTVINLLVLAFNLLQAKNVKATEVAPVLRGRALEIVDDKGRVRASLSVLPEDPEVKMPDGTKGYPETVLLRLISSKGGPNVKLAATEDGSGMVLGGQSVYIQALARGTSTFIKQTTKDGHEQVLKP